MTFADLRALHDLIGVAIDDIERVYRPHLHPGPRYTSQTSPWTAPAASPAATSTTTRRSCSSSATDSDTEESGDTDFSLPPTPVSPISPSSNSVRFANGNGRVKKGRARAQTISATTQPSAGSSPGPMPPPILKQPPLDWPSLDVPIFHSLSTSSTPPPTNITPVTSAISSPSQFTVPSTPSSSVSTPSSSASTFSPPQEQSATVLPSSPRTPLTPHSISGDDQSERKSPNRTVEVEAGGDTPRQKEWKKKCEDLTSHTDVINAVNRIVAACAQMAAMIQKPFLTICDAAMGYHLPACLRFLEASHIVEILREAGPRGLHVDNIASCISSGNTFGGEDIVDSNKLSHILRLLATHHIGKEVRPDVFANNRLSSVMDSGKAWRDLMGLIPGSKEGPEKKYEDTDGTAAFVGLCTDELFKASAYLTDCYLYPPSSHPTSPDKFLFPDDSPDAIPPVPPMPPHTSHSVSAPITGTKHHAHSDSISLMSPMARLRKKKSEISLSLNLTHVTQHKLSPPMTFAQNSLHGSPTSMSSSTNSHGRMHSRSSSSVSSADGSDITGTPPAPPTPSRPGILKRISNRSVSTMPENSRIATSMISPPIPQLPSTPRSPFHKSTSQLSLSSAMQDTFDRLESTPPREGGRLSDVAMGDLLSTPRSGPSSVHARDREMTTPRSTPSKISLTSLITNVSGNTSRQTTPPTPKSPLVTRKQSPPAVVSHGQGLLLGPAFDLQPPATTFGSPRPRTFSVPVVPASPAPSFHETHTRRHASPIPPPIPTKSSLRSLRSASAGASTTSLASFRDKHVRNVSGKSVTEGSEMYAPFNLAFNTKVRYFEWLEKSENAFRLKRFGKAMTGTGGWEVPGSVVTGFPWHELPHRSVVVDVGGGIGSTSMLLANAFPHLRFVIQDRPPVVEMGAAAWRARYPEILDSGRAVFQAHDFFKPQPAFPAQLNCEDESASGAAVGLQGNPPMPAVYFMRVITHDWPDSYVTRILLRLRQAAGPHTRLLLADFVLPLACVDEAENIVPGEDSGAPPKLAMSLLPGTIRTLAPEGSALLANLGKATAHAYWLDLTMRAMFNSQERTLREFCALTLAAGWRITQVMRSEGSVFCHLTAVPVDIPGETLRSPIMSDNDYEDGDDRACGVQVLGDSKPLASARSPPMGDTFLTSVDLPSEAVIRQSVLRGGFLRTKGAEGEKGGKRRGGRERSATLTSQQNTRGGKDGKGAGGGEVRKGFRTLLRMLSKPQLRTGGGEEGVQSLAQGGEKE
ncbi:hypothetical protein BC835DRAFT_965073 [Cytidiella melzeri]|nr:hypothetical protein BC835DRAFT_965073 [Cytidiella melzeri]